MSTNVSKSISKNTVFYMLYNVINILFPFLTGIYVARILSQNDIGSFASAQNLVTYFSILAFLGIPTYALREISKVRNNQIELNKLYSELFILNTISTLIFCILYYVIIFITPIYREQLPLYSICGITVILNFLNNTWLFESLEEYKFISIRNMIFKILMFVFLLLFVRKQTDILNYATITIFGTAGNYVINLLFSGKFVHFTFRNLCLKKHVKSIMFLVVVNFAIEIYTLVDVTMLKIFTDDTNVAIYTYGSKISKILMQVINTFTYVVVPRLSLYYEEKKKYDFNKLLTSTLKLILLFSVPMTIGVQFVSDYFITLLYGLNYVKSATVLNILIPTIIISPIGYLLGSRVLLISNNEKQMIIPVACGAIFNILSNIFLIKFLGPDGAALASVFSEILVMAIYLLLSHRYFKLDKCFADFIKIMFANIIMLVILISLRMLISNLIMRNIFFILCGVAIYCISLILLKEEMTLHFFKKTLLKFKNKKSI